MMAAAFGNESLNDQIRRRVAQHDDVDSVDRRCWVKESARPLVQKSLKEIQNYKKRERV